MTLSVFFVEVALRGRVWRDHLFFLCSFSRRVWRQILNLCLISDPALNWEDILLWGETDLKGHSLKASLVNSVLVLWFIMYVGTEMISSMEIPLRPKNELLSKLFGKSGLEY